MVAIHTKASRPGNARGGNRITAPDVYSLRRPYHDSGTFDLCRALNDVGNYLDLPRHEMLGARRRGHHQNADG